MLTHEEFKSCIQELEQFYNGNVMNGGILEATWFQALEKLPLQQLQSAVAKCFKKHPRAYNFFPSPDQILELAKGEYRPPGENVMGNFTLNALPSSEDRLTPEQKAELQLRGLLTAKIIVNCSGFMSPEEKEGLIERLRIKPTHELEDIAASAERSQASRKKTGTGFSKITDVIDGIKNRLEKNQ